MAPRICGRGWIGAAGPAPVRPAFTVDHAAELFALTPDRPSPAAALLRWGAADPVLLPAQGRDRLLTALRE
ncbi:hypothetical protein ACFY71_37220 [Streptomyces cinerochromogenes]|uniref:hypothetical protein n=1 Tax=Streptomyces cinerochromogenes TaxID=66422 RepID=UPI003687F17B